ncbi:hypothetical protein G4P62_017827, partial [Nothobranchius furzeri]
NHLNWLLSIRRSSGSTPSPSRMSELLTLSLRLSPATLRRKLISAALTMFTNVCFFCAIALGRMDDIQLCKEITRLKKELQKLVSIPENDKSNEDQQKEEELLQQIHKLVETRDFLVDDVEFERLREKEEDKEMADFLKSRMPRNMKKTGVSTKRGPIRTQQNPSPFAKTGLTLLKECCGFTCSIM